MAIKEPVSETPATLVGYNLEKKTTEEEIWFNEFDPKIVQQGISSLYGDIWDVKTLGYKWGKLSANPANFGFIKQEFVESLPVTGESKVLYLLKVYDKEVLVGYRPYFWNKENLAFERLTNKNIPNYRAKKGEHKQANKTAIEVTEPKVTDPLYAKINRGIKGGEIKLPEDKVGLNEQEVKGLIQADKDIISQIKVEYDEDNDKTTLTFPLYILPLHLYIYDDDNSFEEDVYFDYSDEDLLDINKDIIGSLNTSNEKVEAVFNGKFTKDNIDEWNIQYLFFNHIFVTGFNSYDLFYLASGGTKLYKHSLVSMDAGGSFDSNIIFLSNSALPITSVNDFKTLWNNGNAISLIAKENIDIQMTDFQTVVQINFEVNNASLIFDNGDNALLDNYSITDTVTEL